jgi:dTMP kinase
MSTERIAVLETWTQQGRQPDRTWLFDVPLAVAQDRRAVRSEAHGTDRFEAQAEAFHQRVQTRYLDRAREHSERFLRVDARASIEQIRERLKVDLDAMLAQSRVGS